MIVFQMNLVQKINMKFVESQQNFIIIISEKSNANKRYTYYFKFMETQNSSSYRTHCKYLSKVYKLFLHEFEYSLCELFL